MKQVKLKEGSPLATWSSEVILLPIHRETKQPVPGLQLCCRGTTCLVGERHDVWGLNKASKLPAISASTGMGPRVNREGFEGQVTSILNLPGEFLIATFISPGGMAWLTLLGGSEANASAVRWVSGCLKDRL